MCAFIDILQAASTVPPPVFPVVAGRAQESGDRVWGKILAQVGTQTDRQTDRLTCKHAGRQTNNK